MPTRSAGILDDHALRKTIATKQGTIEHVPANDSDIANKKYVDGGTYLTAGEGIDITGTTISGEDSTSSNKGIVTITGGNGIDVEYPVDGLAAISGELATDTNTGIARFDATGFTVTGGNVVINDIYVFNSGDTMTGQLIVQSGNGKIVTSNSSGSIDVQDSSGNAGSISFGNTADIGISNDGVSGGYDYDGAFILKQKTSQPAERGEFIFIEQGGDWRFAIPKSEAGVGTYNPRSMIIAGPSTNMTTNFQASHWGFTNLAMDTSGDGADLGVQNDCEILGDLFVGGATDLSGNIDMNENNITNIGDLDGGTALNLVASLFLTFKSPVITLGDGTLSSVGLSFNTSATDGTITFNGTSGQYDFDNPIDMNTNKIVGVVDPTADQEVATKKYVDDNDHSSVTMSGTPNYITLVGQDIVRGTVDISDDTNLAVTAPIVLTGDTVSVSTTTSSAVGVIELATEDEVQTGTDTTRAVTPDTLQSIAPPIGTVMAWLKSYTSTPATLPTGWVEADGATLSDADSVYDGQVLPDLNGGIFLRGNTTSGATGGSSTHRLTTAEMPSHIHTVSTKVVAASPAGLGGVAFTGANTVNTSSTGGDTAHENRPPFYDIVWIMRIK